MRYTRVYVSWKSQVIVVHNNIPGVKDRENLWQISQDVLFPISR